MKSWLEQTLRSRTIRQFEADQLPRGLANGSSMEIAPSKLPSKMADPGQEAVCAAV